MGLGGDWGVSTPSEKYDDYGTQLAAFREIAKILGIYSKDSDDTDAPIRIDISAIPMRRERVQTDSEHSIGTAARDGRERCEQVVVED